jgi:hypothetical protein
VPSERRLDDGNTLWRFTAWLPKSTFIAAARWRGSDFCSSFSVFSGLMLALGSIFLFDAFAHPLTADAGQILIGRYVLLSAFLRCSLWFGKAGSWC